MNILLLIVDSLRADHLGISGYRRATTPNIDELGGEGAYFKTAIPTMANTDPSIVSILSGLYPYSNGVRDLGYKLDPSINTLQKILRANGYKTIGHDIEMRECGINLGFDVFNPLRWRITNKIKSTIRKTLDWKHDVNPAETLTDFGIKQINESKNEKFFLYLHYVSPHWPYHSPQPYEHMFDPDYKGEHNFNKINGKIKRSELIFNNSLSKEENEHAIAHYDGAIRYADYQIGRLLGHLENSKLKDDTLIILTADHAECFGEHGIYFNHGEYLYDEGIRVPLIFRHPKLPKKKIETQVQLTDILPTILEFLNIPLMGRIDGVSLLPLIREDRQVRKYTFGESSKSYFGGYKRVYFDGLKGKWRMIRTDEWKLIYIPHPEQDIYELYNLKNDPFEKNNLIDKETKIAESLKQNLFLWMDQKKYYMEEAKSEPYSKKDENKVKERLRALGYID